MDFANEIRDWVVDFFSLDDIIKIIQSGDYSSLLTYKGFFAVVGPLFPIVLFFWGGFIHIGEGMVKDSRLGPLQKYILTPSHHRVHHGRNPLYMDTNFCNLLNIWDRVFGTYQPEDRNIPVEYGITRKMIPDSFMDAYFGKFIALAKDVAKASGIKNKLLYIIMPPGWGHTGEHKTARKVRREFLKNAERGKEFERVEK